MKNGQWGIIIGGLYQKAGLHSENNNDDDDGRAFRNFGEFFAILLSSSFFLVTFENFKHT